MPNVFASAASRLLGDRSENSGATDVRLLLDTLDYGTISEFPTQGRTSDSETRHRALLLKAASRFMRLFQLAAPDAPGLIASEPNSIRQSRSCCTRGAPWSAFPAWGFRCRKHFRDASARASNIFPNCRPGMRCWCRPVPAIGLPGLVRRNATSSLRSARRLHPDVQLSWYPARRLADPFGAQALLLADLCLRRPLDRREIEPPFPLSNGSAAGTSWDAAALQGHARVDRAGCPQGGDRGGSIPPRHEAHIMAEALLSRLRHNATGRRSWLLDITTDIGVPCVAAVSCSANGFGLAFGLAARPTLKAGARSASLKCVNSNSRWRSSRAKCREGGEAALNKRDQGHRRRATLIDVDRCPLLHPVPELKRHLALGSTDPGAVLHSLKIAWSNSESKPLVSI